MSKINSIKNITVFQDFSTTRDFYQKLDIINQPDECIITNISYAGLTSQDNTGVYMIWSDIINDYICSFSVDTSDTTKLSHIINIPLNRRIYFKYPFNFSNNVHFTLFRVDAGNRQASPSTALLGDISITMDFITYKK